MLEPEEVAAEITKEQWKEISVALGVLKQMRVTRDLLDGHGECKDSGVEFVIGIEEKVDRILSLFDLRKY